MFQVTCIDGSLIIAQHKGRGQKIYGFFFAAGAQRLRKFPRLVLNGKLDGDKLMHGGLSTVNYGKSGCDTELQFNASQTTCRSLQDLGLVLRTVHIMFSKLPQCEQ